MPWPQTFLKFTVLAAGGLEDFGGSPMAPRGRSIRGATAFNGSGCGGQGPEPAVGSGAAVAAGAVERSAASIPEPATPLSELQPYHPSVAAAAAATAATAADVAAAQTPCSLAGPFASRLRVSSSDSKPGAASSTVEPKAAAGPAAAAAAADSPGAGQKAGRHYWEESDPSRALSMLEDDLSQITGGRQPETVLQPHSFPPQLLQSAAHACCLRRSL